MDAPMMEPLQEPFFSVAVLAARLCLALVFLVSGVHKAIWFGRAVAEFKALGLPAPAHLAGLTVLLQLAAPVMLVIGRAVSEASLALALFTLLATLRTHNFWRQDGQDRLASSRAALANLAVIGGLIMLAATGPGGYVI